MSRVCDLCLEAAEEEGISEAEAPDIMLQLGGDLADHLCSCIEEPGTRCDCGCQQRTRTRVRALPRGAFTLDADSDTM